MKKNAVDDTKTYEIYYNYEIKVPWVKPHQLLALNRGEKEGILKVDIDAPMEQVETFLERKLIHKNNPDTTKLLKLSISDALKRLILPSVEREIRADLTEKAEEQAIKKFWYESS